ncbi:Ig-like domain-containing protein [Thalassobaculum sp.]|uniref:Ig-like domain-containing protein n=1 Tax=Thalassobaculum sp. TaxID=2022740 RepID=UPI0032EC2232
MPVTLVSSSPGDDTTGVAVDANIVLTFSEAVHIGSANVDISIYRSSDDVRVTQYSAEHSGLSINGTQITLDTGSTLSYSTDYYIQIAANKVLGSSSGSFAGITNRTDLNFATAARDTGSGGVTISDGGTSGNSGSDRTITNTGSASGTAAITENTGINGNVATATLPPSVTITSSGPSTAQSGDSAVTTLVNAIDAQNPNGGAGVIGGARTFLNSLATTTTVDIRTIVPTIGPGITTDDPIVITGTSSGGQSEAFVIDMRSITGKILQVDNIEFVSIIGTATVNGGAGANFAIGDGNAQFISLGEGDDTLSGGDGDDTIGSGDGNDQLYGDGGNDTVFGGTGSDTLWGGTDNDVVYGNVGADLLYGNRAADALYGGQDADVAYGGQDADLAYGNLGDDFLYGNLGDDTLFGGQGNDALFGGQDNDLLIGNLGNDSFHGGLGNDTISTGEGADVVVGQANGGVDVVTDFDGAAGDRIQIASNANGTTIDTYAELVAGASDTAGGVQFALGSGNTLTLAGITVSQLQSDWFTFS